MSRTKASELVETVLREISDSLTKEQAIKIFSFGANWSSKEVAA